MNSTARGEGGRGGGRKGGRKGGREGGREGGRYIHVYIYLKTMDMLGQATEERLSSLQRFRTYCCYRKVHQIECDTYYFRVSFIRCSTIIMRFFNKKIGGDFSENKQLTFFQDGSLADFATGVGGRIYDQRLELVEALLDGATPLLLCRDVGLPSNLLVHLREGGGGGGGRG